MVLSSRSSVVLFRAAGVPRPRSSTPPRRRICSGPCGVAPQAQVLTNRKGFVHLQLPDRQSLQIHERGGDCAGMLDRELDPEPFQPANRLQCRDRVRDRFRLRQLRAHQTCIEIRLMQQCVKIAGKIRALKFPFRQINLDACSLLESRPANACAGCRRCATPSHRFRGSARSRMMPLRFRVQSPTGARSWSRA